MGFLSAFSTVIGVVAHQQRKRKERVNTWQYDHLITNKRMFGMIEEEQPFLYSSQELNHLIDGAQTSEQCQAVIDHVDIFHQKHDVWHVGSYWELGVKAAEKRNKLQRRGY
ncbi:hypothetical protein [Alkalihalobacillus sp. BA299]|uniref:hypothetical protein n=1 Tax=Alkalihalobacillus sp. BA299 TaxID=2815938 RepID=UPI001ADABC92|nr:hypothetical protein [Alkalihalobacillus sp. BA299]